VTTVNPKIRSEMSGSKEKIDGSDYHVRRPPSTTVYKLSYVEGTKRSFIMFQHK
jgi:hypothetical protein